METVAASVAKKTSQEERKLRKTSGDAIALDRCYGEIGISAVAAAARYQGAAKNPAYAPAASTGPERGGTAAA
jgi:hypothetical protein